VPANGNAVDANEKLAVGVAVKSGPVAEPGRSVTIVKRNEPEPLLKFIATSND